MTDLVNWPVEFARVIACKRCTTINSPYLQRDDAEDVPQPGYIGLRFTETRVLLVGQNPGVAGRLTSADHAYTAALRALALDPTNQRWADLHSLLGEFILTWPVQGTYFPLAECGLTIRDIAYFNLVRCRTRDNKRPNVAMTRNCMAEHFRLWLKALAPKVVVFIGKWAHAQTHDLLGDELEFTSTYINRDRRLSGDQRLANRTDVVKFVRAHCPANLPASNSI